MTVAELIAHPQALPQDLPVYGESLGKNRPLGPPILFLQRIYDWPTDTTAPEPILTVHLGV